jgi:alpha-L-fucosidase
LTIVDAKASPVISNIGVYFATPTLYPPSIKRSKSGIVSLTVPEKGVNIYYTLDGSEPHTNSLKYDHPFTHPEPAIVRAIAMDGLENKSEIAQMDLDIAGVHWRLINRDTSSAKVIDGDENTFWTCSNRDYNQIIIDLGQKTKVTGFTYLPPQNRYFSGIISEYALFTSLGGGNYRLAATGEFSNIKNSPVLQRIAIPEQSCRYIKLRSLKTTDDNLPSFAEVGVLTK